MKYEVGKTYKVVGVEAFGKHNFMRICLNGGFDEDRCFVVDAIDSQNRVWTVDYWGTHVFVTATYSPTFGVVDL